MFNPKTTFMQRGYFPKIPLKNYLPWDANQFYLNQAPWNQPISSLLITRPTTKLRYQICLHKSERIPSKIKLKALKPSWPSQDKYPYQNGNQTSIKETHRTITQPKPLISLQQTMCIYQLDTKYVATKPW